MDLKEKIFSYGIYGISTDLLSTNELLLLLNEPWAEFVTESQINDLKNQFSILPLQNMNKIINDQLKVHKNIDNIFSGLYVRMGTTHWKEYLTNGCFNFTSKEYFFILDLLIKTDEYISLTQLRKLIGIEPKRMFYIIKKLVSLNYVTKISNIDGNFVKINRDENGYVKKGNKKEKLVSINEQDYENLCENQSDADNKTMKGYEFEPDVPLIYQLKRLIERSDGVTSKDIEEKFGIKIKIGLKILKKLEKKMNLKHVEEFDGKIKRTKFYLESATPKGITHESRISAIKTLLENEKALSLDASTKLKIQSLLGTNYSIDKRTIIRSAKKAGLNVIKDFSKTIISKENIPCIEIPKNETFSEFQKLIYKHFVIYQPLVEIDNGFLPENERFLIFYNFLEKNFIDRDKLIFNFDLIYEMKINDFFSLVPFKRPGYKYLISQLGIKNTIDLEIIYRLNDEEYINWYTDQLKNEDFIEDNHSFLNRKIKEIYNFSSELTKLFRMKLVIKTFDKYLINYKKDDWNYFVKKEKDKIIYEKIYQNENETVLDEFEVITEQQKDKIKNEFEKMETFDVKNYKKEFKNFIEGGYVPYKSRLDLFEHIKDIPESRFYDSAYSYIINNYSELAMDFFISRLEAFKKIISFENSKSGKIPKYLRNVYVDIKKNLILFGNLRKFGDYLKIENQDLYLENKNDDVKLNINNKIATTKGINLLLRQLFKKKLIVGGSEISELENIKISDFFKEKLNQGSEEITYFTEFEIRDDYYSTFFNLIYFILAKFGSMYLSELNRKVEILEDFEIIEFLNLYSDIFKKEVIGNDYFIEIINFIL